MKHTIQRGKGIMQNIAVPNRTLAERILLFTGIEFPRTSTFVQDWMDIEPQRLANVSNNLRNGIKVI